MTPAVVWEWAINGAGVAVASEVVTSPLLKRRVPVNDSAVGRDAVSVGAAAPKLCKVDRAQAAADVGEKSTSPAALVDAPFALGIGEEEDGFFCSSVVPDILRPVFLDCSSEFLSQSD